MGPPRFRLSIDRENNQTKKAIQSEVCKAVKSYTTPKHDNRYRTRVAMHDSIVQHLLTMMSPNSNLTIVMLQTEAGFVSKHNVVPIWCPCPPFIVPLTPETPVVSSQEKGKQYTFPSAANGVEWYERTPNDA
ncbi:hypothetical protein TNCV_934621 [Trichonephila clavipes]|nr:hypothetical protein TNCV_934621 [Trichonephila clavipes]